MNVKELLDSAKKAATGWVDDRAASMGAALSYYTVFSIAPLLIIVIAVAGLVFGQEAAQGAITAQLQGMFGDDTARTIEEMLVSVSEPKQGMLATVVGLVVLLVGATTVFAELQDDLNRVWNVPERAKPSGVWGWIRARILSFGLILAIGFILLVSLVASAAIAAVGKWGGGLFGAWDVVAHVVEVVVSFGLLTALFAVMYRYLPDVKIAWRDVWIGSAVTALLFALGKFAIGLYIGRTSAASGYGAAGSLVVMLLWVYYSAQIFLFGAEFTAAYSHTYGSRRHLAGEEKGSAPGIQPREQRPKPAVRAPRPAPAAALHPAVARTSAAAPVHGALTATHLTAVPVQPAVAVAVEEPHGVTAPIARHPVGAAGLAAGVGAALVYALQRAGRIAIPVRDAPDVRQGPYARRPFAWPGSRPAPRTREPGRAKRAMKTGKGVAKATVAALGAVLVRSLSERIRRGAKRGWHSSHKPRAT